MNGLPQGKNDRCRGGFTLLELLLVVTISGALTATGGLLLQTVLLRHRENASCEAAAARYASMIASVQVAYDNRCLDPFSRDPWMRIETGVGDEWYPLDRMELVIIEGNRRVPWEWDAAAAGPILINIPTSNFLSHQQPGSLILKFPAAKLRHLREGIAIEGIRETVLLKE